MSVLFGKYLLLEKIKTGGMAEIWLAKEKGIENFERLVVIKKVLPGLSEDKEFIEMFLDEGRIAAQLNHPNIVQIYELDKIDDSYYIAMEYIEGVDLQELIKKLVKSGSVPILYMCKIISNAAKGLHFAHTSKDIYGNPLNIVHRDISPQNILISYDGIVKIVDFGIAKATTQSNKTKTGMLKGKLSYMSPEQISGVELDKRSDVFALGIVLYELTVGRRLFKGKSEVNIIRMIADMPVIPPHSLNNNFPKELSDIIMKALEKDINKRYQSAHELEVDLEKFIANQNVKNIDIDLSKWLNDIYKDKIAEIKKHNKALLEQKNEPDNSQKNGKNYLFIFVIAIIFLTLVYFVITFNSYVSPHPQASEKGNRISSPQSRIPSQHPPREMNSKMPGDISEKTDKKTGKNQCRENYYKLDDKCLKTYTLKTISGKYKDIITGITVDSKGDYYITGYFYDTIEFNGKVYHAKTKNKSDIFVTKISKYDEFLWTKIIGGDWNDYPETIEIDSYDNVYITGSFSGTVDFNFEDDGSDIKRSNGLLDVFLTKIDSSGSYQWTKTFGGKSYLDRGMAIAFDKENNVYLGGWFSGKDINIYEHKNITVSMSSKGGADFFVMKLDSTGKYLWDYTLGSLGFDGVTDFYISGDKLYVAGFFSDTVKINNKNYKSEGKEDIILLSLALKDGRVNVINTLGTSGNDRANSILLNNEDIYIAGYLQGDFTLSEENIVKNHGRSDIFISKIGKNGKIQWLNVVGGRGDDAVSDMIEYNNELYLTGWFQGGVDFNPSDKTDLKPSYGSQDMFISRFKLSGDYIETYIIGGEKQDKSRNIMIDKYNNLYLTGWFKGTIDFDLSSAKDHHTSKGLEDAFILKRHLK